MNSRRQLDKYTRIVEELKTKAVARLGDKASGEDPYLQQLLEITNLVSSADNFSAVLELIVDSAIEITNAERGFLMLIDKEGRLQFNVARNINKETLETEEFKVCRSIINQVAATGLSVFLTDAHRDEKFRAKQSIVELGLRMVLCVPLKIKDRLLGLIYVDSCAVGDSISTTERKLLESFASQASIAIDNRNLYESSIRDSLTGLYTYGYFCLRLEEEINRSIRFSKGTISLMMMDLDNFKAINDSYGHFVGNAVLVKIGDFIKRVCRNIDVTARYGGDEFIILMPETEAEGANDLAGRLLKEVNNTSLKVSGIDIPVTLSIGISSFPVEGITDSASLIVEADYALYHSKRKGGNTVTIYGYRSEDHQPEDIVIGVSKPIMSFKNIVGRIAASDATVLISGETGTGKELAARLIHHKSRRKDKPFVIVNCAAIPETLLESELFGYEKGAFTGAYKAQKGKFEQAQTGTVLLDEIGEMPLHLQAKILRAIENKEIDRLGSKTPFEVNVRVIAATNRNLEEAVRNKSFREDLYHRLNVVTVCLPPLRDRPEDIEPLAYHFLKQLSIKYSRRFKGFTKDALAAMTRYSWPGNVRELIHRVERVVIMGDKEYIDGEDLGLSDFHEPTQSLKDIRSDLEKNVVLAAFRRNQRNVTRTAKELGISRKTLRELLKRHSTPD